MRSIPSAPTLAPWSRTVGRPICWWSRATSRGWSRRSTGSVSRRFPPAHRTVDRGHGRIEQRTTWVAPAPPDLNFPHAAQVVIVQWQVGGLHWVRDVTFAEDASRIRTSAGPQVMAALRNLAIGLLRQAGQTRIAAGLRHIGRDPARALAFLGLP